MPDMASTKTTFLSTLDPRPGPLTPCRAATSSATASPPRLKKRIVSYTAVVPAGQDSSVVFVGWTTAQFRYIASQFHPGSSQDGSGVGTGWTGCQYGQRVELVYSSRSQSVSDSHSGCMECSHSSAYLVRLRQLLDSSAEQNLTTPMRCVCACMPACMHVCVSTCVLYVKQFIAT